MEMNEFLDREPEAAPEPEELDVQKAVVESLAADKAIQDERISALQAENAALKADAAKLTEDCAKLTAEVAELKASLEKMGDALAANTEATGANTIALLDRNPEIDDRFPGETRDQVLEVIREARDAAEKDGRIRRAQLLESVLVSNEPSGNLAKKRAALEKFFNDNANVLTGPVIDELKRCGISHKNGEEYLLPAEILKRTY